MASPLTKQGAKGTSESWRDNYRTPNDLLALVRGCLGETYFDPCPADAVIDGLATEWLPNAYINPPFSQYKRWVAHGLKQPGPQIWLANNATETEWFQMLAEASSYACLLSKRVSFIHPLTGQPCKQNTRGQVVFYRGGNPSRFTHSFQKIGVLFQPVHILEGVPA